LKSSGFEIKKTPKGYFAKKENIEYKLSDQWIYYGEHHQMYLRDWVTGLFRDPPVREKRNRRKRNNISNIDLDF